MKPAARPVGRRQRVGTLSAPEPGSADTRSKARTARRWLDDVQHDSLATGMLAKDALYAADEIEDAPEFHDLARAMGTMTRGTWDSESRSADERIQDFL